MSVGALKQTKFGHLIRAAHFFTLSGFYVDRLLAPQMYAATSLHELSLRSFQILTGVFFFCLTLWWITPIRAFGFVAFVLNHFLISKYSFGGDVFAAYLLLIGSCVDSRRAKPDFISLLGLYLLFGILTVTYVFNGIAKCLETDWRYGRVLYTMVVNYIPSVSAIPAPFSSPIGYAFSYGVILIQLLSPLLYLRRARKPVCLLFLAMHLGIALFVSTYLGLIFVVLHLYVFQYDGDFIEDFKTRLPR